MTRSVVYLSIVLAQAAVTGCGGLDHQELEAPNDGTGKKPPLTSDESGVTRPPSALTQQNGDETLELGNYRTFSVGQGLSSADLTRVCTWDSRHWNQPPYWSCGTYDINGNWPLLFPSPGGQYFQATYSDRIAAAPEGMWFSNGTRLQAGTVLDNEQVEQHFYATNTPPYVQGPFAEWAVAVDYEINTELNYDYFFITSTSNTNCNNPGVIQKKLSGTQQGSWSFQISRFCANPWVGVYYIKDGSVTAANEYVKVNVAFAPTYPVGR